MRSAVVTGVSSGIGAGIAGVLIAAGWRVFGSVRHDADAEAARARFGTQFRPLVFDTTDAEAVVAAAAEVGAILDGAGLDGLVNNAGIALQSPLLLQPIADFRRQIEVNLVGPFNAIQAFAGLLGADGGRARPGRIVNISSIGGRIGPPFLAAYAASKHGIEGLSESLRRELRLCGIDVVVVRLGAIRTPMWDKTAATDTSRLEGTIWARPYTAFARTMRKAGDNGAPAESVGRVVLDALTAPRPKPYANAIAGRLVNWTIPRLLPARVTDWLVGRQFGLRPDLAGRGR